MRNAFIDELVRLSDQNENIVLIVGDLGYSVVEPFANRFPKRFFNAGVAEQNMAGIAAGMASEGCHVFIYSIANFPTFRCAEQIRNDIAYQNLAVTVVTVGGGVAYGALGYSHHAVQDYALMRTMPNMLIAAPGDPMEVRGCLRYLIDHPQPSYLRLGKAGEKCFYTEIPRLAPGQWQQMKGENACGVALLSTGACLAAAMQWSEDPALGNPHVFTLPLWSMATKIDQPGQAQPFERIVTIEDHLIDGGFGSWFSEALLSHDRAQIQKCYTMGLDPLVCGQVGSQETLNQSGGLSLATVKKALGV